ncbi:putative serine/threonine-protein kinase gdt2 [Phytophthora citrophthora]|uniref:Serine/threonine-protein kinase gdt2 n=1 Tax=Phytophthora citrophthora TaxID=4793 RepID=A0AAD9LQR6_9STRA|nr:putative serine/threonine-protein kinase gdt2 [Phytophthora citrophthora]
MFKTVKGVAVTTANAFVPGSGIAVGAAFELAKICFTIGQVLAGMEDKASTIKSQQVNIKRDVENLRWVLELLEGVQNQDQLTEGLQKMILKFQAEVKEYERVLNKFKKKNLLKQLVFHNEIDIASDNVMKTRDQIIERLTVEAALDGSTRHRSPANKSSRTLKVERDQRYIDLVDSNEVMVEMSDPENQKEMLAIIARMGRRDEALMESSSDQVVSVMKEKLWASSSRNVRADITNLPDWYITEDEIDVDMGTIVGFGGDAKIYKGTLTDGTPVAVKIFNENVARSEKKKEKFTSMMKLWQRLSHYSNVCHLYGACYFTAAPFVVMEYCDVGPLDKYLRQMGSNRYRASLEVLAQAAQGIAKMHSIGIVHGDLKCDNILITGNPPKAKICDFDRSFDWIALKNKRLVKGTAKKAGIEITDAIRYLAPECVEGKLPNSKSDVYSFGMTIYHALVGKSPYYEITNDEELEGCKLDRELPERDENLISDEAWDLITQCCDGTPDQRPAMTKVVEALRSLLENGFPGGFVIPPLSPSPSVDWTVPPSPIREESELLAIEEDETSPTNEEQSISPPNESISATPAIEEAPAPRIEEDSSSPTIEDESVSPAIEEKPASLVIEADFVPPVIVEDAASSDSEKSSSEDDSSLEEAGEDDTPPPIEEDEASAETEDDEASPAIEEQSASAESEEDTASPALEEASASIDTEDESETSDSGEDSGFEGGSGSPRVEEDSILPAFEDDPASIEEYYVSTGAKDDIVTPAIEQYYAATSTEGDSVKQYNASPSEGAPAEVSIEKCYASASIKAKSTSPAIEALIDNSVDAVTNKASDTDVVVTVDQEPDVLPALQETPMDKEPPEQDPANVKKVTPMNSAKTKWKEIPRSYKIGAVVAMLILGAAAAVAGVFSPSPSSSSSASTQSPTSIPTPTPTPTTPTPVPTSRPVTVTVSTVVDAKTSFTALTSTMFWGIAVSYTGAIYVSGIREIFTISSTGTVQVYAGSSTLGGYSDGQRTNAYLNSVYALTASPDGSIYFCDKNNNKQFVIRKIKNNVVSTISSFSASYDMGLGIAADSYGNVYATVVGDNTLKNISSTGDVNTISANSVVSPNGRMGIALDRMDNIYITENHRVLKYTPNGAISVLAGSTTSGFANGRGTDALFATPMALTVGFDGNLYIADSGNNCIRKLSIDTNYVTTFAGICNTETNDGKTTTFVSPRSIDVAPDGSFYVTDDVARVRKVVAS